MKKLKTLIGVAALVLATATITGCTTLKTVETDVAAWLNSPATQAEISTIEAAALDFATKYLAGLLATAPSPNETPLAIDSPVIVTAQANEVSALALQYPDAPVVVLQSKVHDAFVNALQARATK